jgi:hypothetical protein
MTKIKLSTAKNIFGTSIVKGNVGRQNFRKKIFTWR